MLKFTTAFLLLTFSTSAIIAGPQSVPNGTVPGSAEAATNNVVTDAVTITSTLSSRVDLALNAVPNSSGAAISSLSTILNINGSSVEVSQNASGTALVNGQPLLVNGLPNLGLLMALGYS